MNEPQTAEQTAAVLIYAAGEIGRLRARVAELEEEKSLLDSIRLDELKLLHEAAVLVLQEERPLLTATETIARMQTCGQEERTKLLVEWLRQYIAPGQFRYRDGTAIRLVLDAFEQAQTKNPTRLAWLIENGKTQGHGLKYQAFDPHGMFIWVEDVHAALHFSRRADAELIAQESIDAWRIVQHQFSDAFEQAQSNTLTCSSCGGSSMPMRRGPRNEIACADCFRKWRFVERAAEWIEIEQAQYKTKLELLDEAIDEAQAREGKK